MNYYVDNPAQFGFSDLAVERRRADLEISGISYKKCECDVGTWEEVHVESDAGARSIGKPRGRYYTLSTQRMDLLSNSEVFDCQEEIARILCQMCDNEHIFPARILVVGLGNATLTPDSIGPRTASLIRPTLHVYNNSPREFEELECSEIAVLTPGVLGNTGIDSAEIVKSVARRILPDLIICIDAICTESADRLGSTVQISNSGIVPGGGIGNKISPIDYQSTGSYVFSIGVPTVINSRLLCDTGIGKGANFARYNMFVSPREIDEIVTAASRIIGGAINQAFGIDDF